MQWCEKKKKKKKQTSNDAQIKLLASLFFIGYLNIQHADNKFIKNGNLYSICKTAHKLLILYF